MLIDCRDKFYTVDSGIRVTPWQNSILFQSWSFREGKRDILAHIASSMENNFVYRLLAWHFSPLRTSETDFHILIYLRTSLWGLDSFVHLV